MPLDAAPRPVLSLHTPDGPRRSTPTPVPSLAATARLLVARPSSTSSPNGLNDPAAQIDRARRRLDLAGLPRRSASSSSPACLHSVRDVSVLLLTPTA